MASLELDVCSRAFPNYRDLASSLASIQPGRIMRCACPCDCLAEGVEALVEELGVRDLIDLRGSEELHEDNVDCSPLFSQATLVPYRRSLLTGTVYPCTPGPSLRADGEEGKVLRHNISLLERGRFYAGLLTHVPLSSIGRAAALRLLYRDRESARQVMLEHVNSGGLLLLYKILVDGAKPELLAVLRVVLAALEEDRAVLFFCKAGKDRTGLVAALVLACAGASHDEIVADYSKSDAYRHMALAGIENKPELKGLDVSVFERAPAEAMRGLLEYVDLWYGSLSDYMTSIGFGRMQQARLGHLLRRTQRSPAASPRSKASASAASANSRR